MKRGGPPGIRRPGGGTIELGLEPGDERRARGLVRLRTPDRAASRQRAASRRPSPRPRPVRRRWRDSVCRARGRPSSAAGCDRMCNAARGSPGGWPCQRLGPEQTAPVRLPAKRHRPPQANWPERRLCRASAPFCVRSLSHRGIENWGDRVPSGIGYWIRVIDVRKRVLNDFCTSTVFPSYRYVADLPMATGFRAVAVLRP